MRQLLNYFVIGALYCAEIESNSDLLENLVIFPLPYDAHADSLEWQMCRSKYVNAKEYINVGSVYENRTPLFPVKHSRGLANFAYIL